MALSPEDLKQINDLIKGTLSSEVDNLLKPVLDEITKDVKSYLDQVVDPLEAKLTAIESKAPADDKPEQPEANDPLAVRVKELEQKLADKEAKERDNDFTSHLSEVIDGFNPLFKTELVKRMKADLKDAVEFKDGAGWLTKDGKTVKESVAAFLATDYGKHHLPPTTPTDGAGTKTPKSPNATTEAKAKVDLASEIATAFGL